MLLNQGVKTYVLIILTPNSSTHTFYFDSQLLTADELDDLCEFIC